jgi:1,4-alpha-glucan branching enzyme
MDAETRRGELRVRAPDARRVEIESDLTGWVPVELRPAREAGWWSAELTLPPGLHRVRLRLDGGAWRVPPGLPVESGDFGGTIGVIVTPAR